MRQQIDDIIAALLGDSRQTAAELRFSVAAIRLERAVASSQSGMAEVSSRLIPSQSEIERALRAYETAGWLARKRRRPVGVVTPFAAEYVVTQRYFEWLAATNQDEALARL